MTHNLSQKLKEWRTTAAKKEDVPIFRILSNQVLEDIERLQPKNKEELLSIKGFKDKKYDRYGVALLALINEEVIQSDITDPVVKDGNRVLSVSEYLGILNAQLSECHARIQGEISSLDIRDKVIYFSMKDAEDGSVINCLMWRHAHKLYGVEFELGTEIIAEGFSEIYKPTGRLSFKALSVELVGEGALKKQYEKLKAQLQKEGLFDIARKRPLPFLPQKIGLITSKNGAAIGDFQMNIGQFGFKVTFVDSRVEGQSAVSDLLTAIRTFRNKDIDVLVLVRGGGSLESLLSFNNEALVREIVNFPVPVLVGVGHEKDISLIGLAADKMVSTPTAAAQALNESWQQTATQIQFNQQKLFSKFNQMLNTHQAFVRRSFQIMHDEFQSIFSDFNKAQNAVLRIMVSLRSQVAELRRILNEHPNILRREMKALVHRTRSHILAIFHEPLRQMAFVIGSTKRTIFSIEKILEVNNPERQLKLGYSIVRSGGAVVRRVSQVRKGQNVEVRVQDGSFKSDITEIIKGV